MQPIAMAAVLAIIIPISGMVWLAFTGDRTGLRNIRTNLGAKSAVAAVGRNMTGEQLAALSKKMAPAGYVAWLDKQLAGAGRPKNWPLGRLLMIKPLLALGGAGLGLAGFLVEPSPQRVLIAFAFAAFLYFAPDLLLKTKAEKRREAIRLELPNALDQMLISVQAGLGFEAAMARSAQNGTGPLADEFTRTLQDMQVGRS
ncbi:MAG TPA: type II secretion system F family protein, partial [Arthrobacter sp.]|nr:type II secretion system F family protein [Arthrobacter sp.]